MAKEVAKANDFDTAFEVGLLTEQGANAMWAPTNWGDFLLVDCEVIKTTDSQLKCVLKLLRLICHELTHARGFNDHNERFMLLEGEIFDKALENLVKVRKAAAGLTVASRYY